MNDLWTVIRMELLLFRRGKITWWLVLFSVIWGLALVVGEVHFQAYQAWFHFGVSYFLLTLILTLLTGNQIQRDRDQRMDNVVWSTPVATPVYVCGKYLAGAFIVIGFALLNLLTSIIIDLISPGTYPSLGPVPYVLSWCWLVLPALVFGAVLTLCVTMLSRQRIVAAIVVLLIWLLPIILGSGIPDVLSLPGNFLDTTDPAKQLGLTTNSQSDPSAAFAHQVVHLVQVYVPQAHITTSFLINRVLFLCLAVLFLLITIRSFSQQRRGQSNIIASVTLKK